HVYIDLRSGGDNRYVLTVRDDGVGFPRDLDFQNTESLGLQIVTALTRQLEGTIELGPKKGTGSFSAAPAAAGAAEKDPVPFLGPSSMVPSSCRVRAVTICKPSDSVFWKSRSRGKPTPSSRTVRT